MSPQMPYSPLDALLDSLPRVRKAGKVTKGDDVLSVQRRIGDVFLPIVKRIQAEARADEARRCAADVCPECKNQDRWAPAERENERRWIHRWKGRGIPAENHCLATRIHERLHREYQKGGNYAKTETQTGAD